VLNSEFADFITNESKQSTIVPSASPISIGNEHFDRGEQGQLIKNGDIRKRSREQDTRKKEKEVGNGIQSSAEGDCPWSLPWKC
jgi:hypothetical protein